MSLLILGLALAAPASAAVGAMGPTPSALSVNGSLERWMWDGSGGPCSGLPGINVAVLQSSASGGSPSYAYHWNFGDGSTALGQNATHAYYSDGPWNVTVSVTDSKGTTAAASFLLYPAAYSCPAQPVGPPPGAPPIAPAELYLLTAVVVVVVVAASVVAVWSIVRRR